MIYQISSGNDARKYTRENEGGKVSFTDNNNNNNNDDDDDDNNNNDNDN